jgi:hypothetical protein
MSVSATYALAVDLNGDGDFLDAGEDISAYWKKVRITLGVRHPGEFMAGSASLDVILKNDSYKFSPQHAGALSGFAQGSLIRFQMTYAGTTVTLFQGYIDHIKPSIGANEDRTCEVQCDGYFVHLQSDLVRIAPMANCYTGAVATALLAHVSTPPPVGTGGNYGVGKWGVSKWGASPITAETGLQFYAYVGDNWGPTSSVYSAITELANTERGLFFEARDGSVKFWARDHFSNDLQNAVDATWDGTYIARGRGQYTYGENIINSIDIAYMPRELDTAVSVLGRSRTRIRLPAGTTKKTTVQYQDAVGNQITGYYPVTPVPAADYRATYANHGEYSNYITASVVGYGTRADVTFTNNHPSLELVVQTLWQVRGQRLYTYGREQIHYQDDTSILALKKVYSKQLDLQLLQDDDTATQLAAYIVNQNKNPRGNIPGTAFYANYDNAHMLQVRDRTIGDRIAISEGQTGINQEYWIVGESHDVTLGGEHLASYVFEPTPLAPAGIYGVSKWGQSSWG